MCFTFSGVRLTVVYNFGFTSFKTLRALLFLKQGWPGWLVTVFPLFVLSQAPSSTTLKDSQWTNKNVQNSSSNTRDSIFFIRHILQPLCSHYTQCNLTTSSWIGVSGLLCLWQ